MSHEFYLKLFKKVFTSLGNYHEDNKELHLHGRKRPSISPKQLIYKGLLQDKFEFKSNFPNYEHNFKALESYMPALCEQYDLLADDHSKETMIDLLAYRIMGLEKVKLKVNDTFYWNSLERLEKQHVGDFIETGFLGIKLYLFDLKEFDYRVKLNYFALGVFNTFVLEQYCYKRNEIMIGAKPGDVVIDAGGCWGDTSLYFADKTGPDGAVYSFEFIPTNLEIFKKNLELNPELAKTIKIVEQPLWNVDDKAVYFTDNGPASALSFEIADDKGQKVLTTTIDRFVEKEGLDKVDFIKMDIEGAEPQALEGARATIQKHKPVLAISIYHNMDDFSHISRMIDELNLDYTFYLDHFTIHTFETVLFAIPNHKN